MSHVEKIRELLKSVKYPGFSRDIVSFGLVRDVNFDDGKAIVQLEINTTDPTIPNTLKQDIESILANAEGVENSDVRIAVSKPKTSSTPASPTEQRPSQLGDVDRIIAVASGKGGVGKSTFSVNLACALQLIHEEENPDGKPVGIMDCDIYGPSVPLMMGISGQPEVEENTIHPLCNYGVKVMSMGFLVDEDAPVVWRGPMIMKTIQQFAENVKWGPVSTLIVDLPPGTGDAQLSLVQTLPLAGAVIVTTPQKAAVNVARRGARMFDKVNVPLLGVAENMSYLEDPTTGERNFLFGEGGGRETASALDTDFFGQVPLDGAVRQGCDLGIPIVLGQPESKSAQAFTEIAKHMLRVCES